MTSRKLICPLLAMLAAGTGCSSPSGMTADPLPAQGAVQPLVRKHHKSWIDPAKAKSALLYVADPNAGGVLVYTYPQLTGAGELAGFQYVGGVCTDRRGYVWVLDTYAQAVYEFAHGGTEPINTLKTGDEYGGPGVSSGCSVDPKSGNLAVTGFDGITVFHNGQSTHDTYYDGNFYAFNYIAYDGAGNIYVDGTYFSSHAFGLDELAAGSTGLKELTLSGGSPTGPGGLAWDGLYLDIADSASGTIYQTDGSTVLGTIAVNTACQGQFAIVRHRRIVDPAPCNSDAAIYLYPSGGNALKTVTGGLQYPVGVAISR